jgi:Tol biopolymer transport system component
MVQHARLTTRWAVFAGAALALLAVLLVQARPAHAGAFAGANGLIAASNQEDGIGDASIATVNPDGSNPQRLTSTTTVNTFPAFSPDGKKIVWTVGTGTSRELWIMNADGNNKVQITGNTVGDDNATWSPDGTKIVFTRDTGSNAEVFVRDAQPGGTETNLTNNAASDSDPSWSPDGSKIAFVTTRDGNEEIYTMNPDGTGVANMSNNPANDADPNWSPDGTKIVFASDRNAGNFDVFKMDANGANQTRLTTDPAIDGFPAFSPDGAQIVFRSTRTGDEDVWKMNADGTSQTDVFPSALNQTHPDWQPVIDSYAVPAGASPSRIALVPAYEPCNSPNSTHQVTVNGINQSCTPPTRSSSVSAVGPSSTGFARMVSCPNAGPTGSPCNTLGTFPDLKLRVNITDVRASNPTGPDYNPNASGTDLTARMSLRLSDKRNTSPGFTTAGTMQDVSFEIPMDCTSTAQANPQIPNSIGSTCDANTSANAIYPGIAAAGARAIYDLRRLEVYDSGIDHVRNNGDDQLLAVQGLFLP